MFKLLRNVEQNDAQRPRIDDGWKFNELFARTSAEY